MRGGLWSLLLVVWVAWSQPAKAAEEDLTERSQAPVTVTADRLEADEAAGSVVFIGNAVAVQEDVTIHADRLTILSAPDTREIERVIAEGRVRILQQGRQAESEKAVFDRTEETITLTGTPRLREGQNIVEGEEIVLLLDERRSIVRGGAGGRVNAVFQPPTKERP